MKKIVLILTLLISSLFAELNWVDYEDAIELAEEKNKIVMVMLSREGCPACEYMDNIVFKNEDIEEILTKNFAVVHVDIHHDFMPEGLTYSGTPTFHFLDKTEKKLHRVEGGKNAKDFMKILTELKASN